MEFRFDINKIFKNNISRIGNALLPAGFVATDRRVALWVDASVLLDNRLERSLNTLSSQERKQVFSESSSTWQKNENKIFHENSALIDCFRVDF